VFAGVSPRAVNRGEVECLVKLFEALVAESSSRFAAVGFDRNMFRDALHRAFGMTDDVIMDRGETAGSKKRCASLVLQLWPNDSAVLSQQGHQRKSYAQELLSKR